MKKILAFDTETTSLNPETGSIITISGAILIDETVETWFDFKMKPQAGDEITKEALAVNKLKVSDIMSFPEPATVLHSKLIPLLDKYVNKYDKTDKFFPLGYNVQFDLNFLNSFFKRNGIDYGCGSYQNWAALDIAAPVSALMYMGALKTPDRKL